MIAEIEVGEGRENEGEGRGLGNVVETAAVAAEEGGNLAGRRAGVLAAYTGVGGDRGRLQGGVADVEQGFGVGDLTVDGPLKASVTRMLFSGASVDGHSEQNAHVVRVASEVGAGDPLEEFSSVDVAMRFATALRFSSEPLRSMRSSSRVTQRSSATPMMVR